MRLVLSTNTNKMDFYHLSDYSLGIKVWVGKKMTTTSVQAVKNRLENVAVLVVGKKGHLATMCMSVRRINPSYVTLWVVILSWAFLSPSVALRTFKFFLSYLLFVHSCKKNHRDAVIWKKTLYVWWIFLTSSLSFLSKVVRYFWLQVVYCCIVESCFGGQCYKSKQNHHLLLLMFGLCPLKAIFSTTPTTYCYYY